MEGGVIDRAVVAISYAYDATSERIVKMGLNRVATGVAAVTAAWAASALEAAHAAHAAADAGKVLGMSAEDYTRWSYVVERTGSSLEALRTGLITLQRQMASAKTGTGPAAEALRELGLASDVASGRVSTAADLLPRLADALSRVQDEGKRAELGLVLLGEAGPKMAGLLEQGSAGLELLQRRADALGVTLSDNVVPQSMDLNDALDDLGKYAVGISREVGFKLVPALGRAAGAVRDLAVETRPLVSEGIDRTIGAIGRALDDALTTAAGRATLAAGALVVAWGARGAAGALGEALTTAVPLLGTLQQLGTTAALGAARFALYGGAVAGVVLAAEDLYQASHGVDSVTLRLAESLGVRGPMQDALRTTRELFNEAASAARAFGAVAGDTLAAQLRAAADELVKLAPALQPIADALSALAQFLQEGLTGLLEGIADRSTRAASGFDKFGRYIQGDRGIQLTAQAANSADLFGFQPSTLGREVGVADFLTVFARAARGDDAARGVSGVPVSVPVSVQVQPWLSRRELADIAAEEVRRQVLASDQTLP